MPITTELCKFEFQRVANLAYTGLACRVSLHVNDGSLSSDSTIADWDAVKLPETNGYADFVVDPLPEGGLDTGSDDRWEIGGTPGSNTYIEAAFNATGTGFSFNTVVVRIGSAAYPHSIVTETPSVSVAAGQTQTYRIQLLVDRI